MKRFILLLPLFCVISFPLPQRAKAQTSNPDTGTLSTSDGTIYYETLGKGSAIVFIHGGYGDCRMWDGQFQALATDFQVIRYDHRGFGRSSVPQDPYSPVKDLLSLLEKLNVGRAHLVGNSMGGSLAIDFALKHPERVASLVIVASGPRGLPVPQEAIDRVVAVFKAAEAEGLERAVELWLAHPMVAVSSKKAGVREQLRAMVNDNRAIFRMKQWPSEAMNPPAAKRLKEIRIPTLVVIGGQDTEVNRRMGEEAAK
jgi:pimeloyl-ACP methyl ester carboxylesterase